MDEVVFFSRLTSLQELSHIFSLPFSPVPPYYSHLFTPNNLPPEAYSRWD